MVDAGRERESQGDQRDRGAARTHHFILSALLPTREKLMSLVDAELMSSVEEGQLRERSELASEAEFLRLVGQCSILVVIGGVVAGLIAA
jgi:hypothetical protein